MSTTAGSEVAAVAGCARTPSEVVAAVRAARVAADAAEARVLVLAVEWARAHPVLPPGDRDPDRGGDPGGDRGGVPGGRDSSGEWGGAGELVEPEEWAGVAGVAWDAPAVFAVANRMTTEAGRALIRDAVVLERRLPRVFARVVAGEVPVWRARRVAQAVLGASDDVVAYVDEVVAPRAERVGVVGLERVLEEALLRLHAEERELAALEAAQARCAVLHEREVSEAGLAEMVLRADVVDLRVFDAALSRVAVALGPVLEAQGCPEPFAVRRTSALAVLADPARALALLAGAPAPAPTRRTELVLHLDAAALSGREVLGRDDGGRAWLAETVRGWCGRADTHLVVLPVLDLDAVGEVHEVRGSYRPGAVLDAAVRLLHPPSCVFPWCRRRSRACDLDHTVTHAAGGATCVCNLAPLCRHHHRLKTHAGWVYTSLGAGAFLWREPHGQVFHTDRHGTTDLTPEPVPGRRRPPVRPDDRSELPP